MTIPSAAPVAPEQQSNIPVPQTTVQNNFQGFQLPFGNDEVAKQAQLANSPIPGGHSQTIPYSLQAQPPAQPGQAQLDHRQVVGKGNARAQGIGNAITGGLNAISGVVTALANKKQTEVSTAAQTVFDAQHNIDQAKEAQRNAGDPQSQAYKDAQGVIDQNTKRINGLDPKLQKAIAKGLNIDYTKPESFKSPEAQAINDAKGKFKSEKTFEDQLAAGLPQQMQPNTQAQVKLQAMQEANKAYSEYQKVMVPALARVQVEDRRVAAQVMVQQNAQNQAWARLQANHAFTTQHMNDEEKLKYEYFGKEVGMRIAEFNKKLQILNNDPRHMAQFIAQNDEGWARSITGIQAAIATDTTRLTALQSTPDAPGATDEMTHLKATIKANDDLLDYTKTQYDLSKKAFAIVGGQNPYYGDNPDGSGTGNPNSSNTGTAADVDAADSSNYLLNEDGGETTTPN